MVYVEDVDRPSSWQIIINDGKEHNEESINISLDLLDDEVNWLITIFIFIQIVITVFCLVSALGPGAFEMKKKFVNFSFLSFLSILCK